MKKVNLLVLSLVLVAIPSSWATISISASPLTQSAVAGSTFDVTFSLTVTQSSNPANVAGIDLFLEGLLNQNSVSNISNLFSIQSQTILISNWDAAGPGTYPDSINSTNSTHSGYVQNKQDQGISALNLGSVLTTPVAATPFERLTLSISSSAPAGTYTFGTTAPTSVTDPRGTHITNSGGAYFIPDTQASFSINVAAVPEPSSLAFLLIGGLCSLAAIWHYRKQRA